MIVSDLLGHTLSHKNIIVNTGSIVGSFSNEIIDSPDFFEGEEDGYQDGQGERDFGHLIGSDIGFDQLVSLDANVDATNYLLIKGDSFNSIENALVIANENGTTITLNGDSNSSIDLEAGDNIFIEGDEFLKNSDSNFESLSITSDNNVMSQGLEKGDLTRTRQNGQKSIFMEQIKMFLSPTKLYKCRGCKALLRLIR